EIRSPINGWVTDRPLYPGEMVSAGTPLITVMDLSKVIARAHIPEEQAALVKIGDKATVGSPDVEKPVEGKVTVVSPALDPNSTTVEIWVQASNPKRQMKPGSSVRLVITAATVPDTLVVPATAVQTNPDGGTFVMLAGADGKAHQTAVTVGIKQDQEVEITRGIKSGDKVITAGAYGLPDNTKIKIETANEPEKEAAKPSAESPGKDNDEK
ncbi:MAG: efflux RND transporter periplasmic adaptor subunit, partial [Acidobacteria bacterium]|nr:efflux RND transporter periplasmic adaptor subunit [Acidobacteriota bacterium]